MMTSLPLPPPLRRGANLHRVPVRSHEGTRIGLMLPPPLAVLTYAECRYSFPNGLGTMGGPRPGPKKHGPSPALGPVHSASGRAGPIEE